MRSVKIFAFLLVLAVTATAFAQNTKPMKVSGPVAYDSDQFIVRFNPGANGQAIADLHHQNGTNIKRHLPHGMQLIQVPAGKSVENLVERFGRNPHVEFVHLDYTAYASMVPNDGYYSYQWNFANINMEAAWDLETGDPNVIVAVLDTGLHVGGEDAPVNLVPGYDFAYGDSDTKDMEGHGTHVSGTIAQATNNGTGVAGVAFGVSIMPVKVLDDRGSGSTSDIIDGIDFAVANGADVISMSLGYPPGSDPGAGLQAAVTAAYDAGVVMVAASGNDSTTDVISHPAAYNEIIAVGATDLENVVSYYSNQGPGLEIVAPGGDTNVDANDDGYADGVLQETFARRGRDWGYYFYQGTSMATPHVSAVVGLLLSHGAGDGLSGSTKVEEIRQILHTTTIDLGATGRDSVYGYGLINAVAALEAVGNTQPECTTDADCDDFEACTTDTCNTSTGLCSHDPVTTCDLNNTDGCCPAGCDSDTDADCVPQEPCGDGFCAGAQLGEDCTTCPADCGCISRDCRKGCCGDYICTKWENASSCPIDCL